MAKNEFLPFGIAEGANVLSNQEYERLAARFNGFISGVAKSKELNTVWRQSSVMSSALAQFIVDSDNKDLLDNGDVASIKTRLVAAIKQTISGVGYVTTAAMNLELNKKIDKANISGVKGNDNDKVPSLNLFTTEIGKLAALGYSYSKIESDAKFQQKDAPSLRLVGVNSTKKINLFPPQDDSEEAYFQYNDGVTWSGRVKIPYTADISTLYSSGNTTTDSNGFVRTGSKTALITENVVQSAGTSTSNVMSQKAVTDALLGVNQNWVDVKSQRSANTNYTNSTGKPIFVSIGKEGGGNAGALYINGVRVGSMTSGDPAMTISAIVPAGGVYKYTSTNIAIWVELR